MIRTSFVASLLLLAGVLGCTSAPQAKPNAPSPGPGIMNTVNPFDSGDPVNNYCNTSHLGGP